MSDSTAQSNLMQPEQGVFVTAESATNFDERADPQKCALERSMITRALAGDGRAFSDLVRPHLGLLYRVAIRSCRNSQIAEDAVQDTLTLAFQNLAQYTPGTSLKAYLCAIATRRTHSLLRSEARRRQREQLAPTPVPSVRPDEMMDAENLSQRIKEVLAAMPKKRRQVAMLRLDGDLSYSEIAEVVGSTEGSARVLVHLVMKELKAVLIDQKQLPENAKEGRG